MKRQIALRIFTFLTLLAFMMSCDSDDSKKQNTENEEYGWSETMRGNDLEELLGVYNGCYRISECRLTF